MTDLPVSIVVVSRGRPRSLARTLKGISQLQYWNFEVIVVADPAGIEAAKTLDFSESLKLIPFDVPNISAARNMGLTRAAGEIVAFIDDDAVPEPMWLHYLIAPFDRSDIAATGGFVRGRNGISFQWKAASLDTNGIAHPMKVNSEQATVFTPPKGYAVKTEGTNMAFRRDVLIELNGFDPAFHYFLDETDLNMRLARAGHTTALVPLAEVHHGYAENATRSADRVPKDLVDIGASWAVFQRKYIPVGNRKVHWQERRNEQSRRLLGFLQSGQLEPRDIRRLTKGLDAGYAQGSLRQLGGTPLPRYSSGPFWRFPSRLRETIMIVSRPAHAAADRQRARKQVSEGKIVTLLVLSPTALFHKLTFDAAGFWVQKGGLFGKVERSEPMFTICSRSYRARRETIRVARQRGFERKNSKLLPQSL